MSSAAIDQTPFPAEPGRRSPVQSALTLRELLTPVFYYRRALLIAFVVPVILGIVAGVFSRPVYVAESRLLILLGSEYVFNGDAANGGSSLSFDRAQIVHAEMEILSSKDLRVRTISSIGLAKVYPGLANDPRGLDLAAERMDKDLTVDNVPQSNVIELSLRNRDPQVAAETLNRFVDFYIERRREVFQRSTVTLVTGQRDQFKARLDQVEKELADFTNAHDIGSYDQEVTLTQNQQNDLTGQQRSIDQMIAAAQARLDDVRQQMAATPPMSDMLTDASRSSQLDQLTRVLLNLQNQRREAAAKFTDAYPLVRELDSQIATVQGMVKAAPPSETTLTRRGPNPLYQQLQTQYANIQTELSGLATRRQKVQEGLGALNRRLSELVDIGPRYRDLLRSRTVLEASYQDIARKVEDARVEDNMARLRDANVKIIQPAEAPTQGQSGRLLLIGAGVVLGVVAAFATVVTLATLTQVMVTPRDVESRLDLPVLVTVNWGGNRRARRAVPAPKEAPDEKAAAGTIWNEAVADMPPPFGTLRPSRLSNEDCENLLRLAASEAGGRSAVLQLAAARVGEGVSSMALDLALVASERGGRRVLLIDVDPSGLPLAAVLAEHGALLRPVPPGGLLRVNNTELHLTDGTGTGGQDLSDAEWRALITMARSNFDLVVIDAPAVQRSQAAVVLAPLADLTVLVVEAEETRAAVARNLIDRITVAGGALAGTVFNKRRFYIPQFIYSRL